MLQARLRKSSIPDRFRRVHSRSGIYNDSGSDRALRAQRRRQNVDAGLRCRIRQPDEGRIMLDDEILYDGAAGVCLAPQKRNCGYVFQNYALFPHMTLRENLAFAAERNPRLERHRRVEDMLEKFRLTEVAGRRPHEVSGGQRQRCWIARALIGEPKMLLLDEPATVSMLLASRALRSPAAGAEDFDTPMLLVTHDLTECFELGEEMLILHAA